MNSKSETEQNTVSVVIPAYNAGAYIGRALDSVLAQTRGADEIIVVDDGSSDDTKQVVDRYGQVVRYIHQGNAGVSVARNTGIEAARSKWIAFLDADDEWFLEKLAKQMALLERNPQLVWSAANFEVCGGDEHDRHTHASTADCAALLKGREFHDDYFAAFTKGAAGWTGTMVIQREILQEAGLFRIGQRLVDDLDMWWRIAHRWPRIGYVAEPLARYNDDVPDSITKRYVESEIMIDLLARHLRLAGQENRLQQFLPCAEYVLRYWIHRCFFDERIVEIRGMVVALGHILPSRYTAALRLLTIWPTATRACLPLLRLLNRVTRLPI